VATTLVPFANELSKNFKFVQDMDPKISRSQTFVHWNSISLHDNHANIMCYVHMKYLGTNPISAYAYCDARQSWIKALGGICIYLVIYLVFFALYFPWSWPTLHVTINAFVNPCVRNIYIRFPISARLATVLFHDIQVARTHVYFIDSLWSCERIHEQSFNFGCRIQFAFLVLNDTKLSI
jgi:hypothetical protein